MDQYDRLFRLYEEFDTETLRAYRDFVDLFPPVDSPVALSYWDDADDELARRREAIREAFPDRGRVYADVAARATRDQAFTGLDLYAEYGRTVDAFVLDVDETLRSAGPTDNEIPRETLHHLTEFYENGVSLVICTGQTLENVKGFLIQGLGNELVHSGGLSIVYESGTGVFTPGHGSDTKRLLYEDLDPDLRAVVDGIRQRVFTAAPDAVRTGCHLQGNEFNVTVKPNYDIGSDPAHEVIDETLVYLLDLLGGMVAQSLSVDADRVATAAPDLEGAGVGVTDRREAIADTLEVSAEAVATAADWTRSYIAADDVEIEEVLDARDGLVDVPVPDDVRTLLDRFDVVYYEGDATEVVSEDLDKVGGVEAAFDVLGVEDPFALVLGDSKTDLKVMEWVEETDRGIAAAPEHASPAVLDHVRSTDGLLFTPGDAPDALRTVYALNRLAELDGDD